VLAAAACTQTAQVQTRTLTIHAPRACAPGAAPFALFQPLGDFSPAGSPPSVSLDDVGSVVAGFPAGTQEIVATVTDATNADWDAHAILAASGDVDLLALPRGSPCALTDALPARSGAILGAVDEGHVLVVGGTASTSGGAVPGTGLVDLTRGTVATLAVGLLTPRTNATVTAWSGGAVVAGGTQPPSAGGNTEASFELFASSSGDFTGQKYALSQARARHGATVLASGETLLVGGVDGSGAILGSMEAIDPVGQRARTAGLATLAVPRADPIVMRLASGEILVAGGVDGSGALVSTVEWFPADGSMASVPTQTLPASTHEAFVPLAAGGALAVVAPDSSSSAAPNVWVVSASHAVQAATSVSALTDPRLLAGTAGAPILWTGDRWLVWQPWSGSFTALLSAIDAPGPSADPVATPEPGLGVWMDGQSVFALRFGTRGPYATTSVSGSSPLLLADASLTAPDALVLPGISSGISFDPSTGLSLQAGASVFVTDATFASFTLDANTPGSAPPAVVLRDDAGNETTVDAAACGFTSSGTLRVVRAGDVLEASAGGGTLRPCSAVPASGARVSIGFRGEGKGTSVIASVSITRT
jgi:hypothetical protein